MKYLLILSALFLCACGRGVGSDGETHEIEWPNGSSTTENCTRLCKFPTDLRAAPGA